MCNFYYGMSGALGPGPWLQQWPWIPKPPLIFESKSRLKDLKSVELHCQFGHRIQELGQECYYTSGRKVGKQETQLILQSNFTLSPFWSRASKGTKTPGGQQPLPHLSFEVAVGATAKTSEGTCLKREPPSLCPIRSFHPPPNHIPPYFYCLATLLSPGPHHIYKADG